MKIAFIIESFYPFAPGGSEWSTYYLAKGLINKKEKITVITPNLGSSNVELKDGIKILRYPFYLKRKDKNSLPGNFAFTNPLWLFWSSICILKILIKEKPDVIHVQGKYSIIPAKIANLVLNKPLVATIRDYQTICNYGFCLYTKSTACNLKEYIFKDFSHYIKNYIKSPTALIVLMNLIYAIWGRASCKLMKYVALHGNIIVLSDKQKEIFLSNGFKRVDTIPNTYIFPEKLDFNKVKNIVLFAGRLTPGKGVNLLMNILPKLTLQHPSYEFHFFGNGIMINDLKYLSHKFKKIKVFKQVEHNDLIKKISESKLVVMPSIWPEPFGRVALEAIAKGVPVAVSNSGALPRIVDYGKYGSISDPKEKDLIVSINKCISHNAMYRKKIKKDFFKLKFYYEEKIIYEHIKKYKALLK